MGNQWKPNPPINELEPHIRRYYNQGKSDRQILEELLKYNVDTEKYGLGYTRFREMRKSLGLLGARQQRNTAESIAPDMQELRELFPNAGLRDAKSLLLDRKQLKVPRSVLEEYFEEYEPELKRERLARNLKRKQFWAAGVNALWCMDQHDKWKYKFGLGLHLAVDPFSGYLLWLRVWWNNSNPILICNYYLETVESLGYIPLLTQSDPGTENTRVANAQSFLRQFLDPSLAGLIQHVWKRLKSNIKAEIEWSQLRRRWSPGFESILDAGMEKNLYDLGNPLHVLVFRFIFIPWLQDELNMHRSRINNMPKRKNTQKLTPAGRPVDLHFRPQDFDSARDFKVPVPPNAIQSARDVYVPADHRVLRLVPDSFAPVATAIYKGLGSPVITHKNIWTVYSEMLEEVEVSIAVGVISADVVRSWSEEVMGDSPEDDRATVEEEEMEKAVHFDDTEPAPEGFFAVEGNGIIAEFTDSEGDDGSDEEW